MAWIHRSRVSKWLTFGMAGLLIACATMASRAGEPLKDQTALKLIPADVDYYGSLLRTGEQLDRLLQSKAFAKLKELPLVQMGWFMVRSNWDNPQNAQVQQIKQLLQQDANKQLLALLKDAFSHEIFLVSDSSLGDATDVLLDLQASVNELRISAVVGNGNIGPEQVGKILNVLNKHADQLKLPNIVIGWKVTNTKRAKAQLKRLDDLLSAVAAQQPIIKDRYAKKTIGGGEYLMLHLDGSLVPWGEIPVDELGDQQQEAAEKLMGTLKKLTLAVSLGVRDDYMLLAIGHDDSLLSRLGQGPLLYDADELAPLRAKQDLAYTRISYASARLMEKVGSAERQVDQLVGLVEQLVPMAPFDQDVQKQLVDDIRSLAEYIKTKVPPPAAVSLFSYMTPDGYDDFIYRWTTQVDFDASKKLTILEHLGGTPLAFFAARGKSSPEDYDVMAKFFQRTGYYIEQALLQQIDADQQKSFETLKSRLLPLCKQAAEVTRNKLVPAFQDEQGAVVLDVKAKSKQWHVNMPPAEQPLPMLELAIVRSVTDASKLKEASTEYFNLLQKALDTLHEASTGDLKDFFPEEVPAIKLAHPQTETAGDGTVYYYRLPRQAGLDQQIAPNAGLSNSVLVLSLMPEFSKRLLKTTPLDGQGPLGDVDRPLGAACYLNFAGLIEAIEPWISYGMNLAGGNQGGGAMGGMAQQVTDLLTVIKCFRSVSCVTYQKDGATISHLHWQFEDLK